MSLLKKLYFCLKKKYDPRTGPELILRWNKKVGCMDAFTSYLPCSIEGEKEDDPNTWVWLSEFAIHKETLKKKDRCWAQWIENFFLIETDLKHIDASKK